MNKFKYMDLKQYEYYFSNLIYSTGIRDKPIETKIYSLIKENPGNDLMVIEISTCIGYYDLSIQDTLITKDNFERKSL